MGKKLLLIGQGGREHALAWKLAQSPEIEALYVAPGNPGIAAIAECISIGVNEIESLLEFARSQRIDLTVVGPEAPLMEGIVDRFREAGLKIFGPTTAASRLEGSKVFAKNLLKKYGIPTADYTVCERLDMAYASARTYTEQGKAVVIKADGLAAGKGVTVAANWEEASQAIDSMMKDKSFGQAGERLLVEECLLGEEVSFFAICDGKDYISLLAAQDHKRVFDNDQGPNTGGMGAYVNPPVFDQELQRQVIKNIIEPVIKAMAEEGCPYQGVLYAGLMITAEGPKVLEFNARFGDPETQVLMPMIKGDILPVLEAAASGKLGELQLEIEEGSCVAVILASAGYPGDYEKGKIIKGLDRLEPDTLVFHAGTSRKDENLVTAGGRVLAVVCRGQDMRAARDKVYQEVKKIEFDGMHYRQDIGIKAMQHEV
ncbi:phosphoribosylamine--glycine ligase [Syntrophomonas wolfei]|uniref:Phosphoribosylamine--glycine ligase n=1 Tax=Syntrophomonas wolfei subsp. wolfei (strain DSM 2245B / Goettingen) TaxID=335541 RepID=Q0AW32_SYNWW|nr:phosphoribosylamine--glycine ligase [Syntrophomonas wolfei]ABI69072.1 phosphoribosylamine--glycine ligase [Syntrophomonas wolfei subsp. wolfei str. Goettingen G311]